MEKKKTVSVILDFDTWLALKFDCAKKERSVSSLISEIVTNYLKGGKNNG